MIAIGIGANGRAHRDDFAKVLADIRREVKGGDVVATFGDAVFATLVKAAASRQSVSYRPLELDALRDRSEDCLTRSERHARRLRRRIGCRGGGAGCGGSGLAPCRAAPYHRQCDSRSCPIGRKLEMTVHFIGAGPGAPDLITVRGRDLIARSPVCLYAGSLVPTALLAHCPPGAEIIDTAPMTLDEIVACIERATREGKDVARLHSGDLSVWSALGEQLRRLDQKNIPYTITPGVPAFAAASAALARELTLPEVAQSVVLTRTSGRASSMPDSESLEAFAATRATLAVHLSIHVIGDVVRRLTPFYGADCPAAVVYRASWPEEQVIRGTLATIAEKTAEAAPERTALILVGEALGRDDFRESALYSVDYRRRFRSGNPE